MSPGGPSTAPDVDDLFGSTAAWALDDAVVHANHGSFGGLSLATLAAVEDARRRAEADPMTTWDRVHDQDHEQAVDVVADLVGARPADTTLVVNATVAMDVALQVLPWRPGARILTTSLTYPSVVANVARRVAASDVRLVVVDIDHLQPPEVTAARLVAELDHVDGVVVDAIASATAGWCAVDEVVAAARARGVPIVVDGAHEPGQVALDLEARDADAWVGNLHKWACAPKSLAAVVVPARHHATVRAATPTWLDDLAYPDNARWRGTVDLGPMLVAGQVVAQARAVLARGDEIEARAVAGAAHVAEVVDGVVLPGSGWMRTVHLGRADDDEGSVSASLEAGLAAAGVAGKVTAVDGIPMLRLSCHAYTSDRDHDRLADALRGVVARRP